MGWRTIQNGRIGTGEIALCCQMATSVLFFTRLCVWPVTHPWMNLRKLCENSEPNSKGIRTASFFRRSKTVPAPLVPGFLKLSVWRSQTEWILGSNIAELFIV